MRTFVPCCCIGLIEEDPPSKPMRFLLGLRGSMTQNPKRGRRRNERGGEERDCGAKRNVARRQPADAIRETAARQDSWRSDNQPAKVRGHKRGGGGATRAVAAQRERRWDDKRGTGAAREVTMQQPTAGAREAQ